MVHRPLRRHEGPRRWNRDEDAADPIGSSKGHPVTVRPAPSVGPEPETAGVELGPHPSA